MRILAIETVGTMGTVAALDDEALLAEHALEPSMRSAQSLAPGIGRLLEMVGWRPRDVELVAVASGPGSFTGLRIGVTTAKLFAYAVGAEVIGVNTMAAIAARVPEAVTACSVIVDAERRELFVADFVRDATGALEGEATTRLLEIDAWLAGLAPDITVTGPALRRLAESLVGRVRLVDAALWGATAGTVGLVGRRASARGDRSTPLELVPRYFRRTAAEETWDRKHGPQPS